MHTLFNPENPFWNFMGKITDVACMSLLWLITGLPLFTIGAATAAFYGFTLDAVQDGEGAVWRTYFGGFRRSFKKATVLWLLQLVVFACLGVNLYAAWNLYLSRGMLGLGMLSLSICGILVFLGTGVYAYPIAVYYDFPLKKVITDSFIMAVSNPHVTIAVFVVFGIAGVLTYYLSGLFFFWIGLAIFFSSYFIWGVFLKYAGVKVEKKKRKKKEKPYTLDPYL